MSFETSFNHEEPSPHEMAKQEIWKDGKSKEARGEDVWNPDTMNLDEKNKMKKPEIAQHQIDTIHTAENKEIWKNPPPNLDNPEIATLAFGDFPPKTPESQKTQSAWVEWVKSESPKA